MKNTDILVIGYEEGENLGLQYIRAFLFEKKLEVVFHPLKLSEQERILEKIIKTKPKIVGFSLIFQRMLYEFADLITYLRQNGIKSHFTIGGHFPTMEPESTLVNIPGLDTVIRGEGEKTLLDLFHHIDDLSYWPQIKGLAFRRNGSIIITPPRPLIKDLDRLPFPFRDSQHLSHRGLGIRTILGSRGCYYDCSFCSIRQFYSQSPGLIRRSRSPQNVILEMEELFHKNDTRIFIFEDDDFLTKNRMQQKWINDFVYRIKKSEISDQILWRISCRVDDVDTYLLSKMKEVGLMSVFIGIESGNQKGLQTYNKHYTVNDIHKCLNILINLDIPYEFGFMILNPDSSIKSVKEDIEFLKEINKYKQAIIHFTKMIPYSGTPIALRLKKERKLGGTKAAPDYSFEDPRLDLYQLFLTQAFHYRNFNNQGLVEQLRFAKFDAIVTHKFFSNKYDTRSYIQSLNNLIYDCNIECLEKMSLAVNFMEKLTENEILKNWNYLQSLVNEEKFIEQYFTITLMELMNSYGYT